MSLKILYLVRHGATTFTKENRYSGSNDPPLLPSSRREARTLAHYLRSQVPERIYTSPLKRAHETAQLIKEELTPLPELVVEPRLREIHYGAWEGKTRAEILAGDPQAFRGWDIDPFLSSPPQGEPVSQVVERIRSFWEEAALSSQSRILLISHRTVLRLLACMLLHIPLNEYRKRIDFLPTHLTILEIEGLWDGKLTHHNLPPFPESGSKGESSQGI